MWWKVGLAANATLFVVYLGIALAIFVPLRRSQQVRANRLGLATAVIFLTCGVGHAIHAVHLFLPSIGIDERAGFALREAFEWHQSVWDVLTVMVGLYYWSLRATYGSLMRGAKLFDDLRERQRQALQINDDIVQGLATAHLALVLDEKEASREALEKTLGSARDLITDLLGTARPDGALAPGDLVRTDPAGAEAIPVSR